MRIEVVFILFYSLYSDGFSGSVSSSRFLSSRRIQYCRFYYHNPKLNSNSVFSIFKFGHSVSGIQIYISVIIIET